MPCFFSARWVQSSFRSSTFIRVCSLAQCTFHEDTGYHIKYRWYYIMIRLSVQYSTSGGCRMVLGLGNLVILMHHLLCYRILRCATIGLTKYFDRYRHRLHPCANEHPRLLLAYPFSVFGGPTVEKSQLGSGQVCGSREDRARD